MGGTDDVGIDGFVDVDEAVEDVAMATVKRSDVSTPGAAGASGVVGSGDLEGARGSQGAVRSADQAGFGGVGVDDVLKSRGPVGTAGAAGAAGEVGNIGRVDRDDVDGVVGGDDLGLAPGGQTFDVGDRVRDIYGSVGSVMSVDADGDPAVMFDGSVEIHYYSSEWFLAKWRGL